MAELTQVERLTLITAALACVQVDPEQACSYLERAGMVQPSNYIWRGNTFASRVRSIMHAAELAGILPAPEEKPKA